MFQTPKPPSFGASPFASRPAAGSARPRPLVRKARRGRRDAAKVLAAREAVGLMPDGEGDSLVVLVGYGFDPVALLRVLAEDLSRKHGRVECLRIASLSTSKRCTELLAALIDSGAVASCSLLLSDFQRCHDKPIFAHCRQAMSSRGSLVASQRSHVKAWLMHFADGRKLVVAGSANLRSSRNVELMTCSWDAETHDHLAGWLDAQVAGGKKHEDDE